MKNEQVLRFSPGVTEKIQYYVYSLTAPKASKPFYIGKGNGNRVFAHAAAAIKSNNENTKLNLIRQIRRSGKSVKYQIIRHGLTEKEAFEIEATLIDYLGLMQLANEVAGHEMNDRGLMTVSDINAQYCAVPVKIKEPVLLIIINRLYRRNMTEKQLYQATRGNWVLGRRREKAGYALAIYHGIIRQAYKIQSWEPIISEDIKGKNKTRWRFKGVIASECNSYIGRSITKYLKKGNQSPVLYLNC